MADPGPVRLQVLLRSEARHPGGVDCAARALDALGVEVTASGRASISARADAGTLHRVFGSAPAEANAPLRVPDHLADIIESITVAPPHQSMDHNP